MFYDDQLRDRAIPLFKKAWEAFPEERSNLISYVNHDQLWQMPEMYDYARESLIPKPAIVRAGHAVEHVHPDPLVERRRPDQLGRLAAPRPGRQPGKARRALRARSTRRGKPSPGWTAGACDPGHDRLPARPLRPGIERRPPVPRPSARTSRFPANLFWVIGAELENHGPTRDLAIKAYETSLEPRRRRPLQPAQLRQRPRQAVGHPL